MKNYEITEEQIKELAKGNAKVKNWFPEVFETKLEVGKWYKTPCCGGSIFLCTGNDKHIASGYGIEKNYGCKGIKNYYWELNKGFEPATDSEVLEALTNEAKKRGFVKGAYFKELWTNSNCKVNDIVYQHSSLDLRSNGKCLFHNGKWATLIKTYTKEEAEKMLNAKIVC